MKFLIYISAIISAIAFACFLVSFIEAQSARLRLGILKSRKIPNALLINITRPLWQSLASHFVNLKLVEYRRRLADAFIHAGVEELITIEEFWGFQIVMMLFFAVIGLIFPLIPHNIFSVLICACIGLVFPLSWLRGLAKKRRSEIIRSMPGIIDLLTLSVEAGLDFMAALARVAAGSEQSALVNELGRMLDEIRVGATRADGLRHFAQRCDVPAITSFSALLIQSDKLGASVGPVLRAQSDKLRSDRFQRAERAGAAASQKILFPLVFCIIPAVFIVIFGPLVVQFLTGGFKIL